MFFLWRSPHPVGRREFPWVDRTGSDGRSDVRAVRELQRGPAGRSDRPPRGAAHLRPGVRELLEGRRKEGLLGNIFYNNCFWNFDRKFIKKHLFLADMVKKEGGGGGCPKMSANKYVYITLSKTTMHKGWGNLASFYNCVYSKSKTMAAF